MKLGFVGLGRMGMALLPRLLPVADTLTAWNRTPRAVPDGVAAVAQLEELVERSELVLTMVADDAASLAVHEAMLARARPGQVFVEMGTVRLDTVARLADQAVARGVRFADVPVVGTVAPARQGQLLALAGGDAEVLAAIRPILESFARRVVHCGPVGSGMAMKHCVNGLMGSYFAALAEMLGAGAAAGLSLGQMLDVVLDTPAALPALRPKLPVVLGEAPPEVAYSVAGACKDLEVIHDSARASGARANLCAAALEVFREAAQQGLAANDLAVAARLYLAQFTRSQPVRPDR